MGRATRWLKNLFGIKKDQPENPNSGDRKNKNRRNSTHSAKTPTGSAPNPVDPTWVVRANYYNDFDNEQNKHAIAVAAATAAAAAADAAVAAAQAAAVVVRLTSQGRGNMFSGNWQRWAAVKIQTVFRGYLSRKALRALKGLVKLQALVRGFLVRKLANATLVSMQALIRAQASVRAQKSRAFINNNDKSQPLFRARKSIERCDEARSENTTSIHSRRLSGTFETGVDESPKIVEVDTGRPKSRSRRTNTWASDSTEDMYGQQTLLSPLPCRIPARISIPECRNWYNTEWGLTRDECRFSTAQSTPRFANSVGSNGPVTPPKNVCLDSLFRPYTNSPSYMANTQSFKAKLRSFSAPKQRPEPGPKKKLSLTEMMESRSSLSGVKMQRSCSQVQEVISFKNAVMGNFNKSRDFGRTSERDCYLEGKW